MADYKSSFTGPQIDQGISKANTAVQQEAGKGLSTNDYTTADKEKLAGIDMSTKQNVLVSGENIKTINNQSILGSGNIDIQGGGGTSDYSDLTNKPSINDVELSGNKTSEDLGITDTSSR